MADEAGGALVEPIAAKSVAAGSGAAGSGAAGLGATAGGPGVLEGHILTLREALAASAAAAAEARRLAEQREGALAALAPRVDAVLTAPTPEAAFYLWANVGGDDADFARRLYADQAVTVLPGSYLGRTVGGVNPGAGYIRIALVAEFDECAEGIDRLVRFARSG